MQSPIERVKQKVIDAELEMNPCLTPGEVEEFERRYGVALPEDYRQFLLQIGNGGEGPPEYGLLKLGETDGLSSKELQPELLKEPFPFTELWVWEDEVWDEDELKQKKQPLKHGNVYLGDDGCGAYYHLIVTGPERGQIWLFGDVGITPMDPGQEFITWYEDWLDNGERSEW